jgi:hypothetical protein
MTSRKRPTRKPETAAARSRRPRSPRIKIAVESGDQRRVVIGPARRTADLVFALVAVTTMSTGLGWLGWRTAALIHHSPASVLAVLGGIWLGLLFLGFVLSVQISWRIFGKEEISRRESMVFVEARLLGGKVRSSLPADRRLTARLDELPTRWKRYVYPRFRLVFAHEGQEIGTVSTLTTEEAEAALAAVKRILPS